MRYAQRTVEFVGDWLRRLRKMPLHYRKDDFMRRTKYRPAYVHLAASLLKRLEFQTVIDIGCGNGFLLEHLVKAGKTARGVELSPEVRDTIPPHLGALIDIADFAQTSGQYDLVCCIEMAEHLVPARSAELVRTICARARLWVYFSAAPPGQWGRGHMNCRPYKDWINMFDAAGWTCDLDITRQIRDDLKQLPVAPWLRRNGLVFSRIP